MSNPHEIRISKLYEIVESDDEKGFIMPKNVTKRDLKNYISMMIKDAQPRLKRDDNRPSVRIDDYKVPENYFMLESNTVNFHSSMGTTVAFEDEVEVDLEEDSVTLKEKGIPVEVPNRFRSNDLGQQIVLYIFKQGRKTLEELIEELSSFDKHMLIILVNKLIVDGYLRRYKEEEDDIETLEIVELEKKKELNSSNNTKEQ